MNISNERMRKYHIIMNEYATRKSQEEIAKEYGINLPDVRKVTSDEYKHGVATGKKPMCFIIGQLDFLDKYDF